MRVPVHGPMWGEAEKKALHAVVESGWYTHGPQCSAFERALEQFTGKRFAILCNSGSSANLLAVSALCHQQLGDRRLKPGDEVVTAAVGFPTTLNPIIQNGLRPVLVDVDIPSLVPTQGSVVEASIDQRANKLPKVKAVMLAATLGHQLPEDLLYTRPFNYWLVVDACDGLGTPGLFRGADMYTLSFYPAHQIGAGEGGAVLTDNPVLAKIVTSLRDWGRACWCLPGKDDTCRRRFRGEYDHKYTYDALGYNLKATEFTGALGRVQMERAAEFVRARAENHHYLCRAMIAAGLQKYFILPDDIPASWFGFSLICRDGIERHEVMRYLEARGVQTRVLFGGNLIRQPAYQAAEMRIAEPLVNADIIHEQAFWVGCWPGLDEAQLDYVIACLVDFVEGE